MPISATDQTVEQDTESSLELPEVVDSQLVFGHSSQSIPTVCPSATARAA